MARMYAKVWKLISAADTGVEIPVRCQAEAVRRIVQAVRKEKTAEVAMRKKLGLLRQGRLLHRTELVKNTTQVIIYFKLEFDGRKI